MITLPEIVSEDYQPHFKIDQGHEEYHSDKTAVNSSILKLMDVSPATVLTHYMTHDREEKEPDHFRIGRAVHMAILEPRKFARNYIRMPEFTGRTKDGRESTRSAEAIKAKKEWLEDLHPQALCLPEKQHLQLEGMINSVMGCSDAVALLKAGVSEQSGYYRHPTTGIKCKVRPDLWNPDAKVLIDVKSAEDSSLRVFSKKIHEYKYHLSMAMYADGLYRINGIKPEMSVFIVIEKLPPYQTAVYYCSDVMIQLGHEEYEHSMIKLKHCITTNHWPQRQAHGMEQIDLPAWVYKKGMEVYE